MPVQAVTGSFSPIFRNAPIRLPVLGWRLPSASSYQAHRSVEPPLNPALTLRPVPAGGALWCWYCPQPKGRQGWGERNVRFRVRKIESSRSFTCSLVVSYCSPIGDGQHAPKAAKSELAETGLSRASPRFLRNATSVSTAAARQIRYPTTILKLRLPAVVTRFQLCAAFLIYLSRNCSFLRPSVRTCPPWR
jgi:hypothetical protein